MSLILTVLLWGAIGGAVGGAIGAIIDLISIDKKDIKDRARSKGAIYALIKEKQPYTLKIDYIDSMGDIKEKEGYHTEKIIGNDIYKGQKISAYH